MVFDGVCWDFFSVCIDEARRFDENITEGVGDAVHDWTHNVEKACQYGSDDLVPQIQL